MSQLARIDAARKALAEAQIIDDVKEVRDQAEAVRLYCKAAGVGLEMQNMAAEIKLRAEKRAGEMLASMELAGGDRKSKSQPASLKLDDLAINKDQSHRWQRIAAVPDEVFEQYIAEKRETGEITTAGALKLRESTAKESAEPSLWDSLTALQSAVRKIFDRCPVEERPTLAHRLQSMADELLNTGDLVL